MGESLQKNKENRAVVHRIIAYIHTRSSGGSGGGERGAASLAQPGYMPTRAVAAAAVNGQLWRRQSAGPQEPPRGLGREGGDGVALSATSANLF